MWILVPSLAWLTTVLWIWGTIHASRVARDRMDALMQRTALLRLAFGIPLSVN
jgi:hypothetical protein